MSAIIPILQKTDTLQQLAMALPRHLSAERFARVAITEVRRNPELANCDPASFMSALVQSAQLGLEIGSGLGLSYMIPFRNSRTGTKEVQLIIGYRGLLALVRRSGEIKSIRANVVYNGDYFKYKLGTEEVIDHEPCGETSPAHIIKVYAVADLKDGGRQIEVMSRQQIDQIRDRGRKNPVWNSDYAEMARKTVLRRICKFLPTSAELADAMTIDAHADETLHLPERANVQRFNQVQLEAVTQENTERAKNEEAAEAILSQREEGLT